MAAEEYRPIRVAYRNGSPVRLERGRQRLRRRREPAERQLVQRHADDLPRDLAAAGHEHRRRSSTRSRRCCPSCRRSCRRRSSSASAATDRVSIRESVDDVKFTLVLTVVPRRDGHLPVPQEPLGDDHSQSLALPFSIVGTFAVMWAFGYSIDNLSLMALTLSVGFVVDDAIVMLENIVRHMEMGKPRLQAALDGSKEIAFTIVSMTLSLAAVFIPILFMGGIVGRLMHEFAVTIAAAILVSGLVSLTLTPMLCSRFLKPPHSMRHGRLYNAIERMFDGWLRGLRLDAEADDPIQGRDDGGVGAAARRHGLSVPDRADGLHPERRTPGSSTGRSRRSRASASTRWWRTRSEVDGHPRAPTRTSRRSPRTSAASAAADGSTSDLKPREERTLSADQVIEELRPKFARVPGVRVVLLESAGHPHRRLQSRAPVSVHAAGPRHRGAVSRRAGLRSGAAQRAGAARRRSDLQIKNPEVDVDARSRADRGARPDRRSGRDRRSSRVRLAADLADLRARTTSTR